MILGNIIFFLWKIIGTVFYNTAFLNLHNTRVVWKVSDLNNKLVNLFVHMLTVTHPSFSHLWRAVVMQQSCEWVDVSVFMKMDKIEYRAVIKYLFLKDNMPTQIIDELDSVYGDSAPSSTTVKCWAAEFKCGR